MKELLRTNDLVRLSWAQAILADAGIKTLVLDQHTSIAEGSIGAIQRRLMVAEDNYRRACALIATAGDAST
jgi:Putative prokaryotic signal transducing protein